MCRRGDSVAGARALLCSAAGGGVGAVGWVAVVIAAACAEPAPLTMFAAPSWTDVPQHGLTSHLTQGVALEAARGERESAWIVLQPGGAWAELEVTVTALRSRTGLLEPAQLRLRRGYFERAPDGRFLADSVVPLEASALRDPRHPESSNLPLWLEVEIPPGVAPGLYEGAVRVRIGCEAGELPIAVRVHRAKLGARRPRALVSGAEQKGDWTARVEASAREAGVHVLGAGQGGGGLQLWQIPVGDRRSVGLGLGAPPTSAAAVAWLSERERADALLYREGGNGLSGSIRHAEALWYPDGGERVVESVRLLRLRDALELRALMALSRRRGFGAEVDRWSRRLSPPGGHSSTDPDAYAAARKALLLRHDR